MECQLTIRVAGLGSITVGVDTTAGSDRVVRDAGFVQVENPTAFSSTEVSHFLGVAVADWLECLDEALSDEPVPGDARLMEEDDTFDDDEPFPEEEPEEAQAAREALRQAVVQTAVADTGGDAGTVESQQTSEEA